MIIGKLQQQIYDYIQENSPTWTYAIAQALEIKRGDCTKAVNSLIVKGLIEICEGPPGEKSAGPKRKWLRPVK